MIASLKITSVSSFHLLRIKYYIIAVYVFFFQLKSLWEYMRNNNVSLYLFVSGLCFN